MDRVASKFRDPAFILEHQDFVRGLANKLVFDDQMAEDVAQATWLAVLEHPPEHERSLRAWLATLVRNIAFKAKRGARNRVDREREVARAEAIAPAEELVLRENSRRELVAVVLELDEPYRSAVILRYFDGLEPRAIAERTSTPVATVHTHLKRGLAQLRARLDRTHGSRAAWVIPFARKFELAPPTSTTIAIAAKSVVSSGVMLMTAKKVLFVSIAVVALAALAVWRIALPSTQAVEPDPSARTSKAAPSAIVAEESKPIVAPKTDDAARSAVVAPKVEPTTAAPATSTDGSLSIALTWSDKTPAADVNVRLYVWGSIDPYHSAPTAKSGADGVARFEHVAAGSVTIALDRFAPGNVTAAVKAGEDATKSIEIPRGIDIHGKVVDSDQRAFADAEVYMTAMGANYEGFVVARSGADGSFSIRDVATGALNYLSARAPKRAPTGQHLLMGSVGQTVDVVLGFEESGGEVLGKVLDAAAKPVVGAQVLVGDDKRFERVVFSGGDDGLKSAAQLVATDANGEFAFHGVEPGNCPLQVRARGFAISRVDLEIVAGRSIRRDVELQVGSTLRGTVRDSAGAPVGGADLALGEWSFAQVSAHAAQDGSYVLRDLPVGEFTISASAEHFGTAEKKLFGVSGAELTADFTLDAGNVIHGRIVDSSHEHRRYTIEGRAMDFSGYFTFQIVDDDGRFTITNCPDKALHLDVKGNSIYPIAQVDDVRPGPKELVIEPDPALEPSIRIRGRVVDEAGHPLAAEVLPEGRFGLSPIGHTDIETGRFEFGPYPPGEWGVFVKVDGFPKIDVPKHACAKDEVWDFGDVVVKRGATLTVHFTRDGGGELFVPNLWLDAGASKRQPEIAAHGDTAVSEPLLDGHYLLHIAADAEHNAPQALAFDVANARDVELSIALKSGVLVSFSADASQFVAGDSIAVIQSDVGVANVTFGAKLAPQPASIRLAPGHYTWSGWRAPVDGAFDKLKQFGQGEFDVPIAPEAKIALSSAR